MTTPERITNIIRLPLIIALVGVLVSCSLLTRNHLADVPFATMAYLGTVDPGPDVFMDSIEHPEVEGIIAEADVNSGSSRYSGPVEGSGPNIYGGTGDLATCDANLLASNLGEDETLKTAFAKGIGIHPDDVDAYLQTLQPLVLDQDIWVTNHGYRDGQPRPFQAVLQKGTGVLVDALGVPRVRCKCGNPLTEAWPGYTVPEHQPVKAWEGYDLEQVISVYPTDKPNDYLDIYDLVGGQETRVEFTAEQHNTLTEILHRAQDAPKTVPGDMGVSPNYDLLQKYGYQPATEHSLRPDNTTTWKHFTNGFTSHYLEANQTSEQNTASKNATAQSAQTTTTRSIRAKEENPLDRCWPEVVPGQTAPGDNVSTWCDGQWMAGAQYPEGPSPYRWDDSKWAGIPGQGRVVQGIGASCYDPEILREQGMPEELISEQLVCEYVVNPSTGKPRNCGIEYLGKFMGARGQIVSCNGHRTVIRNGSVQPVVSMFDTEYLWDKEEGWQEIGWQEVG